MSNSHNNMSTEYLVILTDNVLSLKGGGGGRKPNNSNFK